MIKHSSIAIMSGFICTLGLSGCGYNPKNERVIARATSPNGQLEAVHAEDRSGGATIATSEDLFVVEPGAPFDMSDRIATLEGVCHLKIKWLTNDVVEVSYYARHAREDRGLQMSNSVGIRYRWLGRDNKDGC